MFPQECAPDRRNFLKTAAAFTAGASGIALLPEIAFSEDADVNIIGPKKGYSPQIGPTNNYCKWFHVCEHESNHNGQIKFLKSRLPGAKPASE